MSKIFDSFRDLPHKLHLGGGKVKASDKQLKQYKEFFDIKPACKYGFPDGATAMAYDDRLKILAVGTKSGELLVFGAPGVEFFASHGQQPGCVEVKRLVFLPNEGRLITLTSDNTLHKWELNGTDTEQWAMSRVGSLEAGPADDEAQKASAIGLVNDTLWVGYKGGKVRVLDIKTWKFTEADVTGEAIGNSLPDDAKALVKGWGPVVAIEAAPKKTAEAVAANAEGSAEEKPEAEEVKPELRVAIGFRSGPVAIVTAADVAAVKHLVVCQAESELECLSWCLADADCSEAAPRVLITGHSDGAYTKWDIGEEKQASLVAKPLGERRNPYGPFPCQPITGVSSVGSLVAFAGGLAKNTHAGQHSVTLLQESEDNRQACFELPAPASGLVLLPAEQCLLALCPTRLLAIDLASADWKPLRPPYLSCLVAADSPVTVARVFGPLASLPEALRSALDAAASAGGPNSAGFSDREWPLTGGRLAETTAEESQDRHLLVTGHADGGVSFWLANAHRALGQPLAHLDSALLFESAASTVNGNAEDAAAAAFPPLRRVGVDFPSSGSSAHSTAPVDPRLAIFGLDIIGEALVVSGAGGQVIVWSPTDSASAATVQLDIRTVRADLLASDAVAGTYEWTGPTGFQVRSGSVEFGAPFRPSCLALVEPPSPVTSVAYSQRWGILAVGTAHGLAIVDSRGARLIEARPTLPAAPAPTMNGQSDSAGAAGGSEESGITKSLRQSFRKLKKLRPGRKQEYAVNSGAEKKAEEPAAEEKKEASAEAKEGEKKEGEVGAEKKADDAHEKKTEETSDKKTEEVEEKKAEEATEESAEKKPEEAAEAAAAAKPAVAEKRKLAPLDVRPPGQIGALLLAETTLVNASTLAACLFAGDAAGRVLAFQFSQEKPQKPAATEATEKKTEDGAAEAPAAAVAEADAEWRAHLTKELHLRHGAPVAALYVLSVRDHSSVTDGPAPDGPQELLVVSEEQVKLFALPSLKPRCKARLSSRLVSCGYAAFASSTRPDSREMGLTACLDDGSLLILGLPALRVHGWHSNFRSSGEVAFCCCRDRAAGSPVAVFLEVGGAEAGGAAVATVYQLAGKLGAAFVRSAGLILPEGARKPAETAPTAGEAPAAAAASAAVAADEAQVPANGEDGKAEEKEDAGASAAAGSTSAVAGNAGVPSHVAADITMDDIKEYATGTAVVSSEPPIPEDKRESTVSSGGAGDACDAVKEAQSPTTPTPVAEVKAAAIDMSAANAEVPPVAASDHCNSNE